LHLIDGHAVWRKRERAIDARAPVLVRLAEHAGDEIDVDLRESQLARERVGAVDFGRAMGAAVQLENPAVEVLDAEAEARDAEIPDRAELGLGQRARLTLERDLFRARPRRLLRQTLDE